MNNIFVSIAGIIHSLDVWLNRAACMYCWLIYWCCMQACMHACMIIDACMMSIDAACMHAFMHDGTNSYYDNWCMHDGIYWRNSYYDNWCCCMHARMHARLRSAFPMVSYGFPWFPELVQVVVPSPKVTSSMVSHCFSWFPMVSHGFPWYGFSYLGSTLV